MECMDYAESNIPTAMSPLTDPDSEPEGESDDDGEHPNCTARPWKSKHYIVVSAVPIRKVPIADGGLGHGARTHGRVAVWPQGWSARLVHRYPT